MRSSSHAAVLTLAVLLAPASVTAQTATLDTSFGTGGVTALPDFAAEEIALDHLGRVLVAGFRQVGPAVHQRDFAIARLTANGALDASFGTGGIVVLDRDGNADWAHWIGETSSHQIVVAGWADTAAAQVAAVRLRENGSLDPAYGQGGWLTSCADAHGFTAALTGMDELFIAGDVGNAPVRGLLTRFGPTGQPDPMVPCTTVGLDPRQAAGHVVYGVAPGGDNTVIVGGEGGNGMFLARFRANPASGRYEQDTSWGSGGVAYVSPAFLAGAAAAGYRAFGRGGVARQADGKILLAGWDTAGPIVLRFDPATAALDPTFRSGVVRVPAPGLQVYDIEVTPGGVIFLAAGTSVVCLGPAGRALAICGPNGVLSLGGRTVGALVPDSNRGVVMVGGDGTGRTVVFRYAAPVMRRGRP